MNSLDKKWKEFLYAACGFGPNILMVFLGAYFTDAMNPAGLNANIDTWSLTGFSLIAPSLFGGLWMLSKVFDGIVDIPLATFTDNLRTRWGRRRPALLIAFVPMTASYLLAWSPLQWKENSVLNTIWITAMLFLFFASYTLSLITFYGSLSSVCRDEAQRIRVGSFKSFFDTIGYCIVYALVPVFIGMGINIRTLVLFAAPLMLTILIPLFIIKEGEKYGEGRDYLPEARVGLAESFRLTIRNKIFLSWIIPNACAYFGLQMFLTAQNALISGVMNLSASYAAILNTCAFAPVPLMLFLYYRLIRKKGIRFAYQICLLTFAVAILNFCVGSEYLFPNSETARIVIGCIGSVIGSFGIGAFFSTPYMVPSQIAAMEFKITGKDHTAMYFAVQSLSTSIAAAISGGLVYEYIKNIQTPKVINGVAIAGEYWKVGVSLVPAIVCATCLIGFFACFKMPKEYSEEAVRKAISK
ncbi:MAG: MFS transporter [Eubacteriales bacterium]